MKNRQIMDSWSKIEPNSTADARMLSAILARNRSENSKGDTSFKQTRMLHGKGFVPFAACFILVLILVAIVGNYNRRLANIIYTVELDNGSNLTFHRAESIDTESIALVFDVTSRELSTKEINMLFGTLPIKSAYASFRSETNVLVRVEAKTADATIIFAASDIPITDLVIEGNEKTSEIQGIPVTAGYFITNANSQGIKNILYFASFTIGDVSVYVVLGGEERESEKLRTAIASVVAQIIDHDVRVLSIVSQ